MSKYSQEEYDRVKRDFELCTKKINNYESARSLPENESKRELRINDYKSELVATYNNLVSYINAFYASFSTESKPKIRSKVSTCKAAVLRALTILDLHVDLPENFEKIDIDKVINISEQTEYEEANTSGIFLKGAGASNALQRETLEQNDTSIVHSENSDSDTIHSIRSEIVNVNMSQSLLEFLTIATKLINYKYDGDPLSLKTFINKVELLESATLPANEPNLRKYVISCLEGKALESLPDNPATLQEIKDALKAKIKFDNSKVVEGRLLALKADQNKLNEYAKKAEELSDSLKRALVLEGIPQSKANEMAIDKTVELCRSNARSDMVRGILAATKFESAAEVVAKYIVESRTETTEKQILQFRRQNTQNVRGRGFQNNRYGYQNNDNNNFGNNNQNFRGNFRGRGRGRGRGNYNNFGQRQDNQIFYAENEQAPPPGADEQQQNVVALQAEDQN